MAKLSSYGTEIYRGTSGAGTLIAQVQNISGPGLSLDTEDVTSHDSTGGWAEFIGTILQPGEVSFDINYAPTAYTHDATTGLIADLVGREVRNFKLIFPDTGTTEWLFSALVTGFEPSEPVAGALSASVTMTLTGQPTLL
jgi:predicted secreted protein